MKLHSLLESVNGVYEMWIISIMFCSILIEGAILINFVNGVISAHIVFVITYDTQLLCEDFLKNTWAIQ
jgi:hypothetical protein